MPYFTECSPDFGLNETLYLVSTDCAPCWTLSRQEEDGFIQIEMNEEGDESGIQYHRSITMTEIVEDDFSLYVEDGFEVLVDVSWEERGKTRNVQVATFLTDWK